MTDEAYLQIGTAEEASRYCVNDFIPVVRALTAKRLSSAASIHDYTQLIKMPATVSIAMDERVYYVVHLLSSQISILRYI